MFVFQKDPLQSCKHVSLNMFVRAIDVTYQEELSFRHDWPFIVYVLHDTAGGFPLKPQICWSLEKDVVELQPAGEMFLRSRILAF